MKKRKDFDYHTYLASREWSLLREEVRKRSGNTCEHCFMAPQQAVHHLTYERIGHEELEDLLAVCNPCHEYLSGKSSVNPLSAFGVVGEAIITTAIPARRAGHWIVPFPGPGIDIVLEHVWCRGAGCIWCTYADPLWALFLAGAYIPGQREGDGV